MNKKVKFWLALKAKVITCCEKILEVIQNFLLKSFMVVFTKVVCDVSQVHKWNIEVLIWSLG